MTDSGGRNVGTRATTPSVPTSVTQESVGGSWRRPDIQGLRAVAVLSVIAFHAEMPIPGGFSGVDVFFVISGYVITLLLLREHGAGTFSFASFYARRAQRLLPALAVMVATVFVVSWLVQSPFGAQQTTAATGVGAMLLVANVVIVRSVGDYFDAAAEANPLLNTWSLSVEEQFYLVFPLLLMVILVKFSQRWTPLGMVGLLTVCSFSLSVVLTTMKPLAQVTNQPEAWAFYLSPARVWEFGVGALLAIAVARHQWLPNALQAKALGSVGVVLLAGSFWLLSPERTFPGTLALLPTLGTAALIAAGLQDNPVSRLLSTRPAVLIGDWSYSLYLWHWPVVVFALLIWSSPWTAPMAAVVSVAPALASYYLLERPIRRRDLRSSHVALASLSASAAVIALGLLLAHVGPSVVPGIRDLEKERQAPVLAESADCFVQGEFRPEMLEGCWFRGSNTSDWVLLAGDSHAAHLLDGLVISAHALDLNVFSITGGTCPFLRSPVEQSDVSNCSDMNQAIWKMIDGGNPPEVVVLSEKGVPVGLDESIEYLNSLQIPVIVVRDVPRWAPVEERVQNLPCRGGALTLDCTYSLAETSQFSEQIRSEEARLFGRYPAITVVDPWPLFCADGLCSPIQNGQLLYADLEHLNGLGSEYLSPLLRGGLEKALL